MIYIKIFPLINILFGLVGVSVENGLLSRAVKRTLMAFLSNTPNYFHLKLEAEDSDQSIHFLFAKLVAYTSHFLFAKLLAYTSQVENLF